MNKKIWTEIFHEEKLKGDVRFDEPMTEYTSFRIGGPAEVMFFPEDLSDLRSVLRGAKRNNIQLFILGLGTNLLVKDGGIPGVTVNLKNLNKIEIVGSQGANPPLPPFTLAPLRGAGFTKGGGGGIIYAEAGVPLPMLLSFAARNGLEGLEFTAGIPGALGGAIIMNAGTKDGEMKDVVDTVTLMDSDGEIKTAKRDDISFGYRRSGIEGMIVVNANLKLRKGDPEVIKEGIKDHIKERKNREPSGLPNAGSVFKNPESVPAGKILEELGFKGFRVGDAEVSRVHANFIVNRGKAKASDVISIINAIKEKVLKERKIVLEPEIRIVGINGN
ncbi:MAG: UDP-N-acetylmuramate dehydrogenase [Nitrospirota bacterium]